MKNTLRISLIIAIVLSIVSCSSNDNLIEKGLTSYQIEFSGEVNNTGADYPFEITYYKTAEVDALEEVKVNSQTNGESISESKTLSTNNKIGFKFSVNDNGGIRVNKIKITNLSTNVVVFDNDQFHFIREAVFLYDITSGTYTLN